MAGNGGQGIRNGFIILLLSEKDKSNDNQLFN